MVACSLSQHLLLGATVEFGLHVYNIAVSVAADCMTISGSTRPPHTNSIQLSTLTLVAGDLNYISIGRDWISWIFGQCSLLPAGRCDRKLTWMSHPPDHTSPVDLEVWRGVVWCLIRKGVPHAAPRQSLEVAVVLLMLTLHLHVKVYARVYRW